MRRGITLLELLVVLAITGVLFAFTLSAVQNARRAAVRIKSMNNLRQINLAIQNYASSTQGRLPTILDVMMPDYRDNPPFSAILPLMEGDRGIFVSPADPSLDYVNSAKRASYTGNEGHSSYAYNALVFVGKARLPDSIPDGMSQTIGIAEHYANCAEKQWVVFIYSLHYSSGDGGSRRASFADRYYGDVVPISTGNRAKTLPSVPGKTFQAAPRLDESDATVPQTPHASGMLVGMMDGSVRAIARGVAPEVFWGAATPDGGEVAVDF
jgi:prepilin-type N-terminal cleavage/methylation domain-containing protein